MVELCGMGKIHCSIREVAAVLGVTPLTLETFFNENPGARQVFEQAKAEGARTLRRAQMESAIDHLDGRLLIWLGKQLLGQRDNTIADINVRAAVATVDATPGDPIAAADTYREMVQRLT